MPPLSAIFRNAKRAAVQLSIQRRNDFTNRFRCASARWDDADRSSSRAPQILVWQIEDPLVVRDRPGADAANGTVYVVSKDMPSIVKLVPGGESTSANAGESIPARRAS